MRTIDRSKGILAALISSSTFGMIPLFSIPLLNAGMNETSILLYRYIISAIAIAVICVIGRNSLVVKPKVAVKLLAISLIYAGTAIALLYSYKYIASGVVTTIHFMYPIFVVILMSVVYKEKLSVKLIALSLMALCGVGLLCLSQMDEIDLFGLALAGSTAVTYAIYIVCLNDKDLRELESKTITFYMLVFGALLFLVVNTLSGTGLDKIPDTISWINIFMLALLPTVVSIMTLVTAVKYIGSTTTSILGAAEPLVAMIVGVTLFSETFTIYSMIGLILIIIAVTYVIILDGKKSELE